MQRDSRLPCRVHVNFLRLSSRERALVVDKLAVHTLGTDASLRAPFGVVLTLILGEAPLAAHHNLLPTGKLELGTAQRLARDRLVLIFAAHAHEDLTDTHTRAQSLRLSKGAAHACLQTIGACARKHLVDA